MDTDRALRMLASAAVNGDFLDDDAIDAISAALTTSDVTVAPPKISDHDLLVAAGAVGCPIIADGRPCDLQYGHRGKCWSHS